MRERVWERGVRKVVGFFTGTFFYYATYEFPPNIVRKCCRLVIKIPWYHRSVLLQGTLTEMMNWLSTSPTTISGTITREMEYTERERERERESE